MPESYPVPQPQPAASNEPPQDMVTPQDTPTADTVPVTQAENNAIPQEALTTDTVSTEQAEDHTAPQETSSSTAQTPPCFDSVVSYAPEATAMLAAPKKQKRKKKKTVSPEQKRITALAWIAMSLAALLFIYCIVSDLYTYFQYGTNTMEAVQTESVLTVNYQEKPSSEQLVQPDAEGKYTVAGVAEAVAPSIVEILTYAEDTIVSSGSGIILTEDGYIVTNAHVLQEGETFAVSLHGMEEPMEAKCIGQDTKTDLAVLKIKATGLPAAVLGDADALLVGEEVVAIGNPAGLTGTVTNGIVSALHRQVRSGTTGFEMDCIQTNAAISPGNSGGALVNLYGQVVGITSSKYASIYSGSTYEGLGFAISINAAMPVIEELASQGYVSGRVRMGITFQSLAIPEVLLLFQQEHQLEETDVVAGLWISEIAEDCDIANTELLPDDVIYCVESIPVTDYDTLNAILNECKAGDTLMADCCRYDARGNRTEFQITFQLMEDRSGNF